MCIRTSVSIVVENAHSAKRPHCGYLGRSSTKKFTHTWRQCPFQKSGSQVPRKPFGASWPDFCARRDDTLFTSDNVTSFGSGFGLAA
jgi:hypothetical protein